ncbi:MAG: hypothetical protein AAF840_13785 [Bacteroidota bacterium]
MERSSRSTSLLIPSSLALAAGILFLGFGVDRTAFWEVLLGFSLAFVGYAGLLSQENILHLWKSPKTTPPPLSPNWGNYPFTSLQVIILIGVVLRLLLVFAFPLLSDDIYRFIWDGHLIRAGINPFSELPAYYLEAGRSVPGLTPLLYDQLNSPDYYTIYPPVAQATFTLATVISPNSWYGAAIVMKVILFAAEMGTLWLLWRLLPAFGLPRNFLLFYWLNPLIIIEITGNLHFEGAMVFCLLLALYFLQRAGVLSRLQSSQAIEDSQPSAMHPGNLSPKEGERKVLPSQGKELVKAAGAFALSVASKLLPLMFLPFLIVRLWRGRWGRPFWIFSVTFGVFTLLLFLPLLTSGFLTGFGSSLDLYFRKFEFNASLYYLARAYGYYEIGWNQIARFGPLLAKLAVVSILVYAAWEARRWWTTSPTNPKRPSNAPLPTAWMFAFTIYLFCATTVHPWYLSLPIVLCCFGYFRYPLVWSFFIVLTYTSYTSVPYQENLWLVALEYLEVGLLLIVELRRKRSKKRIPLNT